MDDDPVLRSLGADLERDDPALAALLTGQGPRRHRAAWLLLAVPLLVPALLLPAHVVLGFLALLLIVSSPLLAVWLCAGGAGTPDARA
jgi:hypothetical protein